MNYSRQRDLETNLSGPGRATVWSPESKVPGFQLETRDSKPETRKATSGLT